MSRHQNGCLPDQRPTGLIWGSRAETGTGSVEMQDPQASTGEEGVEEGGHPDGPQGLLNQAHTVGSLWLY